jgi:hypothetical protein
MIPGFHTDDNINIKVWNDDKTIQQDKTTGEWTFATQPEENDMQDDDISGRFHNNIDLTQINITDFIQQNFTSGDRTPVFAHVYEPVGGTIEVLVTIKHVPGALDLIKTIKVELCRVMNPDSIQKSFLYPEDVVLQATTTKIWTPFDIQTTIPETLTNHPKKNTQLQLHTK